MIRRLLFTGFMLLMLTGCTTNSARLDDDSRGVTAQGRGSFKVEFYEDGSVKSFSTDTKSPSLLGKVLETGTTYMMYEAIGTTGGYYE